MEKMNLKLNLKRDQKSTGAAACEEQEMGFPRVWSGGTPWVPLCYHHPQLLAFAPDDSAHIPGGTPGGWGDQLQSQDKGHRRIPKFPLPLSM